MTSNNGSDVLATVGLQGRQNHQQRGRFEYCRYLFIYLFIYLLIYYKIVHWVQ